MGLKMLNMPVEASADHVTLMIRLKDYIETSEHMLSQEGVRKLCWTSALGRRYGCTRRLG